MKIRDEWKWLVVLAAVCVVVYLNSTGGEFIYDDLRQIVRNPLIQDNSRIFTALTSDVWAFKGGGEIAASNYWRPTFTAWHILNYRLFGGEPFGWHITNILLHIGVCLMAFGVLRRWNVSQKVAFAVTLVFAVHPVHAESIAWISGSPDLLFSLAFLASLWFAQNYSENWATRDLVLSAVFYALALGAKEIGIIALPIFYLIVRKKTDDAEAGKNNVLMAVIAGIAVCYFLLRMAVLGSVSRPVPGAAGFFDSVLTAPAIFVFYLRQIVFPTTLSINYPLTAVNEIASAGFIVPLFISLVVFAGIVYAAMKDRVVLIGAFLFLLLLAPTMYAGSFTPEQIVHDRYLYLPLLGALMIVFITAAKFLNERNIVIAGAIIAAVFGFQTVIYNQTFANDVTLWANASTVDGSAFSLSQYGSALYAADRFENALEAYSASIDADANGVLSHLGRGQTYLKLRKYTEAEADLKFVTAQPIDTMEAYQLFLAYEALGVSYSEQKRFPEAIANFEQAIAKLPIYKAALTVKLAVVLYQSGEKQRAFTELVNVQDAARTETLPGSRSVFLRLGMLYAEAGRKEQARDSLQEFLTLTANSSDKTIAAERELAARQLQSLR
jgi:tetratricopeptide (TPR) repeat protein